MRDEIEMPDDWDEHAGWEAHYAALPPDDFWYKSATTSPSSFSFDQLGPLRGTVVDFKSSAFDSGIVIRLPGE